MSTYRVAIQAMRDVKWAPTPIAYVRCSFCVSHGFHCNPISAHFTSPMTSKKTAPFTVENSQFVPSTNEIYAPSFRKNNRGSPPSTLPCHSPQCSPYCALMALISTSFWMISIPVMGPYSINLGTSVQPYPPVPPNGPSVTSCNLLVLPPIKIRK